MQTKLSNRKQIIQEIEPAWGGAWEVNEGGKTMRHKENFKGDGYMQYLDCSDDFMCGKMQKLIKLCIALWKNNGECCYNLQVGKPL